MKMVPLSLMVVGSFTIAQAMDSQLTSARSEIKSPLASGRSEINGSPVNIRSALISPQVKAVGALDNHQKADDLLAIPSLDLDVAKKEDSSPSREPMEEMALMGIDYYNKKQIIQAISHFDSILGAKPKMQKESPKSTAIAKLYLGRMAFRRELGPSQCSPETAYKNLLDAAHQTADMQVAAQAAVTLSRIYYLRGVDEKNNDFIGKAILGCNRVIELAHDKESVDNALLILSDAAESGNGMERSLERAFELAEKVARQPTWSRPVMKGQLRCAELLMKGIQYPDWNFENRHLAWVYLKRPQEQEEFKDLQSYAKELYLRLKVKEQQCYYQEGKAYLRIAMPVQGYHEASKFWDNLASKNIKTLQELKERDPVLYGRALRCAEHCFEQAAYDKYSRETKVKARQMLGWIYKETGRSNKFEEFQKMADEAKIRFWYAAAATNQ